MGVVWVIFPFILQNILDDRLKHANFGVVLTAVCLFLRLTADMPHLQEDIYSRIRSESKHFCRTNET